MDHPDILPPEPKEPAVKAPKKPPTPIPEAGEIVLLGDQRYRVRVLTIRRFTDEAEVVLVLEPVA